ENVGADDENDVGVVERLSHHRDARVKAAAPERMVSGEVRAPIDRLPVDSRAERFGQPRQRGDAVGSPSDTVPGDDERRPRAREQATRSRDVRHSGMPGRWAEGPCVRGAGASVSSVMRSIGSERNTGPVGGVSAIVTARPSTLTASSALRISYAHLVNGSAIFTR